MFANPAVIDHLENSENLNPNVPLAFGSRSMKQSKRIARSSLESTLKKPISGASFGKGGRNCPCCNIHSLDGKQQKCKYGCKRSASGKHGVKFNVQLPPSENEAFQNQTIVNWVPDSVFNIAKKLRKKLKLAPKHSQEIEDFIVSLNHSFQKAEKKYKKYVNLKAKEKIKKIKIKYLKGGEFALKASSIQPIQGNLNESFEFNDVYTMFNRIKGSREYRNYERDVQRKGFIEGSLWILDKIRTDFNKLKKLATQNYSTLKQTMNSMQSGDFNVFNNTSDLNFVRTSLQNQQNYYNSESTNSRSQSRSKFQADPLNFQSSTFKTSQRGQPNMSQLFNNQNINESSRNGPRYDPYLHREQFNATMDLFDLANAIKKLDLKLDKYLGYIREEESKILETFASQQFHTMSAQHPEDFEQGYQMNPNDPNFERGTMLIGSFLDKHGHRNSQNGQYYNPKDIARENRENYDGTQQTYTNYFEGTGNLYDDMMEGGRNRQFHGNSPNFNENFSDDNSDFGEGEISEDDGDLDDSELSSQMMTINV